MADMRIRPSTTLVKVTYTVAVLLAAAITYLGLSQNPKSNLWYATYGVPALIFGIALKKHLGIMFIRMEVEGDRLKYETGMLSRTSRSVPLAKVQDVTVSQSLGQRILGLGDLSIETAGESSRITIHDIADPRGTAEQILSRTGHNQGRAKAAS